MIGFPPALEDISLETQAFYRRAVHLLNGAGVPFLVGGAYALAHYTGVVRHTKDFDVFIHASDCRRALDLFARDDYRTELTFPHWLGKAFHGEDFVDVIFSSGNGVAKVDEGWFEHAPAATFLGEPVRLCPVEEIIWSKSFVCERERFDGADINHLLRAHGRGVNWGRLLERFGPHWRVLLAHLVMFGFVYPSERDAVPAWVMTELTGRLQAESRTRAERRVCQGTLLSRIQYLVDMDRWGYADARLDGESGMTSKQVFDWTQAGLRDLYPGSPAG
jgi:hypothetical protein